MSSPNANPVARDAVDATTPLGSQAISRPPNTWHTFHTFTILAFTAAIVGLMIVLTYIDGPNEDRYRLLFWLLTWGLMAVIFLIAGHGINARPLGVLIDESNRLSVSRLQVLLWSSLVLSAVATAVAGNITNAEKSWEEAFDLGVPTELWVLMGISTASLAGSAFLNTDLVQRNPDAEAMEAVKTRLSEQQRNLTSPNEVVTRGQLVMLDDPSKATFGDLFKGDGTENADHVDLGKVQMFFFTVVLVLAYALLLGEMFVRSTGTMEFPKIDDSMVALLGFSHAGFLTTKAVSNPSRSTAPNR